jgi:hypothetical protein
MVAPTILDRYLDALLTVRALLLFAPAGFRDRAESPSIDAFYISRVPQLCRRPIRRCILHR